MKFSGKKEIFGYRDSPLSGLTTPAIREDGSIIVAAQSRVSCLNPNDGSERWFHKIDGIPSAPNIGPDGTIYISAWSHSWAGMYVISPEGNPTGRDDPEIFDKWSARKRIEIASPSVDSSGNVYIAFHANYTHPDAISWDPEGRVAEDYFYACSIYDSEGNRIAKFVPEIFDSERHANNAIAIDNEIVYYQAGPYNGIYTFKLENLLSLEVPSDKMFLKTFYFYDGSPSNTREREKWQKAAFRNCHWIWDNQSDVDENGNKGALYGRPIVGYPAIGKDGILWARVSTQERTELEIPAPPTRKIIRFDTTNIASEQFLDYETVELTSKITANPTLDSRCNLYLGSSDDKVHLVSPDGTIKTSIDTGHPVSSIIIGPKKSIIVVSNDGYLFLLME
ncbi:MAG: hypothetical protein ACTSV2_19155 [Candidatus Thorarchaeota archaeon]